MAYPQAYRGLKKLIVELARRQLLEHEETIPHIRRALNIIESELKRGKPK